MHPGGTQLLLHWTERTGLVCRLSFHKNTYTSVCEFEEKLIVAQLLQATAQPYVPGTSFARVLPCTLLVKLIPGWWVRLDDLFLSLIHI